MCVIIAPRIKTRFTSFRTDYVRLKKKVKDGVTKSGSSPKKLTPLQRFKLSRGKFLDEFCKPSALSEEMGLSQASQSVPCLKVAVQQRVGRGRRHHIHDGHDVTDGRGGVCHIQHISDDATLPEDERQGQEQGCHWAAGDHVPRQSGQAEGVQFKALQDGHCPGES